MPAFTPAVPPPDRPVGDAGSIVLGWLLRLGLVLGVVGVVLFDAISVGASRLAVEDQAVAAARAGAQAWHDTRTVEAAYTAAVESAQEADPGNTIDPTTFVVTRQGAVTLRVDRTARTFVAVHVPPLRPWTRVTSQAQVDPAS